MTLWRSLTIALAFLVLMMLTIATATPIPPIALAQQPAVGMCQQRPLPNLSAISQRPAQLEPPKTIAATDPQLESLREATFLLGEGERLSDSGEVAAAREKWLAAVAAYQLAGDQLGEADAYFHLAASYPSLEVALDPALTDLVMGYYEAAFFASADVYETLIQKELTYNPELLGEAESLYERGRAYYEVGNCQAAQPLLEDARALFQEAEFGSGELRVLITVARCQFNPDEPFSAIDALATLLDALLIAENLPQGAPTTRRYLAGVDLFEQGQWEDAREALTEAQTQYQAAGDTVAAAHAAQDLGGVLATIGDLQQAEALYREALAVYVTTPDEYSLYNQAGVHHNLGNIAMLTGRYQEAMAHYQTGVDLWRAIGEPAQEVASLTGLGWALRETGDYSQALTVLEAAQAMQQRLTPNPETEGDLLNNMALVYISLAQYDQALSLLNQALTLRRELPHRQKELETLNNIASVEAYLGQFSAALNTYDTVLILAEETGADRIRMSTQVNVASIHIQQGWYQQGLATYLELLPIYRQTAERPFIAMLEADIGLAYRALGDLDNARAYLGNALTTFEAIGNFEGAATTRGNLGSIALQSGDLLEAQTCLEQTLSIWQALDNPAATSGALGNLAWIAAARRDFGTAVSRAEEALALVQQSGRRADEARMLLLLGLSHLGQAETVAAKAYGQQALELAANLDDPAVTMAAQALLGTVYYAEGNRPLAYEHIQQATAALEQLQGIITVAELKASFLGQLADAYDLAVLFAADLGRYEDAFYHAEQARARAFLDQLSNGPLDFRAQASADLLAEERDLQAQIAARHRQLAALHNRPVGQQDAGAIETVENELARLEASHADLLVALQVRAPDVAAWFSTDVDALATIQGRLDEQTTLLEYYVTEEKTLAFVITRNAFTAVSLPQATPDNLTAAVTNLHRWFNLDNPHPKPLRDLHGWLVAPLMEHLETPLVGIIPHQALHYVPFAALTDGQNYLGGQRALFVLPSASSLGLIQENAARLETAARPALVFGNPATGDSAFPSLAYAAAEAAAVADLLGATAYTAAEAQETRFWSEAQGAEVVHLAAHGRYNVTNPLYSAIRLAPAADEAERTGVEDGRLEVHELYDLALHATQLVVLSACQTHVAEVMQADRVISAGDEIVGLTRAFFAAGAPSVVSSLWRVDDAATEALMVSFYRHWKSGLSKAEALQMAQRDVQATHASPFYWAGFVLSGDYGRVDGSPEPPPASSSSTLESPPAVRTTTAAPEPEPEGNGRGPGFCSSAIIFPLLLIGIWGRRNRSPSRKFNPEQISTKGTSGRFFSQID